MGLRRDVAFGRRKATVADKLRIRALKVFWRRSSEIDQKRSSSTDRLGRLIALLALFISGGTAYFANIRQSDDLRVAVSDRPSIYLAEASRTLALENLQQDLTFINARNRTAAVLGVDLEIRVQGEPMEPLAITYDIDPFVIQSSQIIVKQILPGPEHGRWTTEGNRWLLGAHDFVPGEAISACLVFAIAIPDGVAKRVVIHLFDDELFNETNFKPLTVVKTQINPPNVLFSRSSTIFGPFPWQKSYNEPDKVCSAL